MLIDEPDHLSPTVADRGGLQDVAKFIHFKRQRVLDARVSRVALIVVADGLAGMGEEHGVAVAVVRLQAPDGEVLLGDRVGSPGSPDRFVRRPGGASSAYTSWRSIEPLSARQASRSSSAVKPSGKTVSGSSSASAVGS